jgi:hypothetical protein
VGEEGIADVIFVCTGFSIIDRIADALDFFVPRDMRKGAPIIRRFGYWWLSGTWPSYAGVPRSGMERKQELWRRLEEAVLHSPGTLEPAIRQAIAAERDVPTALRAYVSKVHRHAYKVIDEDVAELRAAGYSEDQIFEATLAAALGAGRVRLHAGLAALREPAGSGFEQPPVVVASPAVSPSSSRLARGS